MSVGVLRDSLAQSYNLFPLLQIFVTYGMVYKDSRLAGIPKAVKDCISTLGEKDNVYCYPSQGKTAIIGAIKGTQTIISPKELVKALKDTKEVTHKVVGNQIHISEKTKKNA